MPPEQQNKIRQCCYKLKGNYKLLIFITVTEDTNEKLKRRHLTMILQVHVRHTCDFNLFFLFIPSTIYTIHHAKHAIDFYIIEQESGSLLTK